MKPASLGNSHHRAPLLFLVAGLLSSIAILAGSAEIEDLRWRLETADTAQQLHKPMRSLVEIGSQEAIEMFVGTFSSRIVPSDADLAPFLSAMLDISDSQTNRRIIVPVVKNLRIDSDHKIYIWGILARFGEPGYSTNLIGEYGKHGAGYSNRILRVLSRTGESEAIRFVVDTALQSDDPTLKLAVERYLRDAGNSSALEVMRGWPIFETRDIDLSVLESYLTSIIEFGNEQDQPFLARLDSWIASNWLTPNSDGYVMKEDYDRQIKPLLKKATSVVDSRRKREETTVGGGSWIVALVVMAGFALLASIGVWIRHTRER